MALGQVRMCCRGALGLLTTATELGCNKALGQGILEARKVPSLPVLLFFFYLLKFLLQCRGRN